MVKTENKISLPTLDSLFTTQEQRDDEKLEKIIDIPIKEIDDFNNHPFNVDVDDELLNSIEEKGVLVPTIVRKKENGRYEMVSGHRRKKASQLLNIEKIPCIVKNLTDDDAIIVMVDSNLQREKILPSEKAYAYKLKMEAMNHQGKSITSRQVGDKLKTADIIGKKDNSSGRQVQRYIRLTYLIPKLLEMVDNESKGISIGMALSPAVEISYLSKEEQEGLLDAIECYVRTPSLSQAIKLKKMSQAGKLTVDDMYDLLEEKKPNETPKLRISMNKLNYVLPNTLKNDKEREEYVIKAVEWYDRYQKRQKERDNQSAR